MAAGVVGAGAVTAAAEAGSAAVIAASVAMIEAQSLQAATNITASGVAEMNKSVGEMGMNLVKSYTSLLSTSASRGG